MKTIKTKKTKIKSSKEKLKNNKKTIGTLKSIKTTDDDDLLSLLKVHYFVTCKLLIILP